MSSPRCVRSGFVAYGGDTDAGHTDSGAGDAGLVDVGRADAGSSDAANVVSLGDYAVELAAGWNVEVYRDFSEDFSYPDQPFIDYQESWEGPDEVFLLPAPFPEGLGVVAGRRLLVLAHPEGYEIHDYTPAAIDGEGPDDIDVARAVSDWAGTPAIFFSTASWNAGDGLYRVELDWSISRLSTRNNMIALEADPAGLFDGLGTPGLYIGGDTSLVRFEDSAVIVGSRYVFRCALLAVGDLACAMGAANVDQPLDLVLIRSGTHALEVLRAGATRMNLVDGALARLPHDVYAILNSNELYGAMSSGAGSTIATNHGFADGWWWQSGVAPPAEHVLGSTPSIYLLEGNGGLERHRILRFFQ